MMKVSKHSRMDFTSRSHLVCPTLSLSLNIAPGCPLPRCRCVRPPQCRVNRMTGHLRTGLSRQAPFERGGREEGIQNGCSGYGVQVINRANVPPGSQRMAAQRGWLKKSPRAWKTLARLLQARLLHLPTMLLSLHATGHPMAPFPKMPRCQTSTGIAGL